MITTKTFWHNSYVVCSLLWHSECPWMQDELSSQHMQDDLCWHNFNYLTLIFEYKPLNVGPHWHWSRDLKIIYLIMIIYYRVWTTVASLVNKILSWTPDLRWRPVVRSWLKKGFIFSLESTDLVTLVTIKQRVIRYWVDITWDKDQQFDQHWSFTT